MSKTYVSCITLVALVLGLGLFGCPPAGPSIEEITANFETSQHGTREGKVTWWNGTDDEPGFGSILANDVDINGCTTCHAATLADGTENDPMTYQPGCADCHIDGANPTADNVPEDVCMGCHGRQAKEEALAASPNATVAARFTDVHKAADMTCTDCHGFDEIHGDGTQYSSMLESPGPKCEDCHAAEGGVENATVPPMTIPEHDQHMDNIDCSTCHMQSVIACYNCHIESLVESHAKKAAGAANGFMLLLNRDADEKIYPGSYQSATFDGNKMIAIGGFSTHTITAEGRMCDDCHANANVVKYNEEGIVDLGSWDATLNEGAGGVVSPSGVIPIPEDYKTSVRLDFLDFTAETGWTLTDETKTPDLVQIAPGLNSPLTAAQMTLLSTPMTRPTE
jgi:hypothetical protein